MAPTTLTRPSSSFAIQWLISAYLVSGPKRHKVYLGFQEHPQFSATSKHMHMLVLETFTSSYWVPKMEVFHTIPYSIKNHAPRMTHLWVPQTPGQRERKEESPRTTASSMSCPEAYRTMVPGTGGLKPTHTPASGPADPHQRTP